MSCSDREPDMTGHDTALQVLINKFMIKGQSYFIEMQNLAPPSGPDLAMTKL